MPDLDDDELTALTDADLPRVDLVGRPASGIPRFLIAKQDEASAGLLDPEFVRSLIAKSDPEPRRERAVLPSGVTLSGSPADIAAFIHKAAQRAGGHTEPDGDVAKAEMSSKSVNDLDDDQFGYIEPGGKKDESGKTTPRSLRHFPLNDADHVRNALARASQSPFGDKAMPKIRAAAKREGIEVSKEAGVPDTVTKDAGPDLDDSTDGMDPTVPLAAPDGDAPGDPADPGSPAWEAIDAATACKWTSILARARVAVDLLAEREMLEAATGDDGDMENAFDLQDVCSAIDYAIGVLAPFAVAEQSEADCGEADMMAAIGKAMTALEAVPLASVEGLCAVAKSGRVLSSANEAHIREAAARLTTVLSSLPAAPVTDDGQPVAKEGMTVAETQTPARAGRMSDFAGGGTCAVAPDSPVPGEVVTLEKGAGGGQATASAPADAGDGAGREVLKSALRVAVYDTARHLAGLVDPARITQVAKADGEGKATMQAVFDEDGNLVGIVDPADITPVAGAGPKAADGDGDAEAQPPADSDMTPAPPAETGTPAAAVPDDGTVTKSSTDVFAALESAVSKAVAAALDGRTPQQDVAKQADVAGLLEEVETLKARLETVESTPAAPKVFTNGQTPPQHQMRGQDRGSGRQVDVAKARERKAELYSADAPEQARIAKEMQQDAIAYLETLHAAR